MSIIYIAVECILQKYNVVATMKEVLSSMLSDSETSTAKPVCKAAILKKTKNYFLDQLSLNAGQKYYRMLQGELNAGQRYYRMLCDSFDLH